MYVQKTHPVGRAGGAGLARPTRPGPLPHGDLPQCRTADVPRCTHSEQAAGTPDTCCPHPALANTRYHLPAPTCGSGRGATLTPERRTLSEMTVHTYSAPACARALAQELRTSPSTDPGHPSYPKQRSGHSWLHHLGSLSPEGINSLLPCWKAPGPQSHTPQTGSQERRPLPPVVTWDNICQPTPSPPPPHSADPALTGSLDRGRWGGQPDGGRIDLWARPGRREQRAQAGA